MWIVKYPEDPAAVGPFRSIEGALAWIKKNEPNLLKTWMIEHLIIELTTPE